jgi:hypothetical protein
LTASTWGCSMCLLPRVTCFHVRLLHVLLFPRVTCFYVGLLHVTLLPRVTASTCDLLPRVTAPRVTCYHVCLLPHVSAARWSSFASCDLRRPVHAHERTLARATNSNSRCTPVGHACMHARYWQCSAKPGYNTTCPEGGMGTLQHLVRLLIRVLDSRFPPYCLHPFNHSTCPRRERELVVMTPDSNFASSREPRPSQVVACAGKARHSLVLFCSS